MLPKLSKTRCYEAGPQQYIDGINSDNFETHALELFAWQYAENPLYHSYCNALRITPEMVTKLTDIPFLPVSFFKTHPVLTQAEPSEAALVFESSGTSGDTPSRHFVTDPGLYEAALLKGFTDAFGAPEGYVLLALLPSYLERPNASLVRMAQVLMAVSRTGEHAFYLNNFQDLTDRLLALQAAGRNVILLGVTFALLDFAEAFLLDLRGIIVMETGGMKGRREEWTRDQVHNFLKTRWNLESIATEYGMTELLSQAYARRDGLLTPSPTMRVLIRDVSDPLCVTEHGSGALNIIDLANVHSCAFLATEDVGRVHANRDFEVLGRLDYAALRGCSLMTA